MHDDRYYDDDRYYGSRGQSDYPVEDMTSPYLKRTCYEPCCLNILRFKRNQPNQTKAHSSVAVVFNLFNKTLMMKGSMLWWVL